MKIQATDQFEKNFANHIFHKGLIPEYILHLDNKSDNPLNTCAQYWNRLFTRENL